MALLEKLQATRGCHCLIARKSARAITRLYETKLRPHGLRATQFSVLAALTLKGPTRLGELAGMLGLERTTLTRIAGLLDERGWIADGRTDDARERLLCVTDAGRAVLDAALPAWQEAQQAASERLDGGLPRSGGASKQGVVTPERLHESRQFVDRALQDFGLMEAFESCSPQERDGCLRWIASAAGEREEEKRVSRLLDDLSQNRTLATLTETVLTAD
jgi:DNA-binding MarR family transcriptional regulator